MVPDPLSGIGVLRSRYRAREYLARAKTVADCKEQYHLFVLPGVRRISLLRAVRLRVMNGGGGEVDRVRPPLTTS